MLPFVALVTPDLKWVAGFSGMPDVDEFLPVLDHAEKTTLMDASPEDAKKLDVLAGQAAQAAEKSLWPKVLAAGKSAAEITGRCPARAKILAAVTSARTWADGEMTKALDSVKSGGDRAAARSTLKKVSLAFAGEPEAKEAEAGVKAFEKLSVIDGVAADRIDAAREKALKDFAGTRWVALFEKPATKPAAAPPR